MNPKSCIHARVEYAPRRREAKRAEKSATPQQSAAVIPRNISKVASGRVAALRLEAQMGHHFLQVFPDFALGGRVAKQIGGMIGRDEFCAEKIEPFPAKAGNSLRGLQQGLRRATPEGANHFGLDAAELTKQERRAGGDFVLLR